MKKYRFYLPTWADVETARDYRKVLAGWIKENDGVKTPLYVKSDIYVWSTDRDVLHMVIESHDFDDLPKRLDNYGSDILDVLIDAVANRDGEDEYDPEEALYEYLTD